MVELADDAGCLESQRATGTILRNLGRPPSHGWFDTRALLRSLEALSTKELLATGGDSRQAIDASSQLNKYGCSFEPRDASVALGSCTASSTSLRGFEAASRLHDDLRRTDHTQLSGLISASFNSVRSSIEQLILGDASSGASVFLTPSGTDAEYVALALFAGAEEEGDVENIVIGPLEVGSGTSRAAGGTVFDAVTPNEWQSAVGGAVDEQLHARTTVREVSLRDNEGQVRPSDELDGEVEELVAQSISRGSRTLLHIVAHSKTGVHAPSLDLVDRLRRKYGSRLGVAVDAAQGRFSRRGVRNCLRRGYMIIITGSKFFGGPPFAGALLVPELRDSGLCVDTWFPAGLGRYFSRDAPPQSWANTRASLPHSPNVGLLLRWTAALAEMRAYYGADPGLRRQVLRTFAQMVPEVVAGSPHVFLDDVERDDHVDASNRLLQSNTTVFSFGLRGGPSSPRFGRPALERVSRWMWTDLRGTHEFARLHDPVLGRPVHLGQAVSLGGAEHCPWVLRFALGAPRIVDLIDDTTASAPTSMEDAIYADIAMALRKLEYLVNHAENSAEIEGLVR